MFGTILALLTLVVGGYVLQKEIRKERRYTKLRDEEGKVSLSYMKIETLMHTRFLWVYDNVRISRRLSIITQLAKF